MWEFIGKAFEWPLSSLEGVAFLEVLILAALTGLWITVLRNAKASKEGRARIYKMIKEKTDELWKAIDAHNKECQERNEKDERWKGRIEGYLEASETEKKR